MGYEHRAHTLSFLFWLRASPSRASMGFPDLPHFVCADRVIPLPLTLAIPFLAGKARLHVQPTLKEKIVPVLVACEYSQIVTSALRVAGIEAYSCDILNTEGNSEWHIVGDAIEIARNREWDGIIAHPPCTYLANSGVRWLYTESGIRNCARWDAMYKGAQFFRQLWECKTPCLCIENPIPHKYAAQHIEQYDQIVQPWMFGDNETKAICLWLKGLPPLIPPVTRKPENVEARVWRMPPGPDRQKERSRFFPGVARAMAEQWAFYLKPPGSASRKEYIKPSQLTLF